MNMITRIESSLDLGIYKRRYSDAAGLQETLEETSREQVVVGDLCGKRRKKRVRRGFPTTEKLFFPI